jgi:hypothetical protein
MISFVFIKDGRQLSTSNSDYQDRKRNSLRDNNNKQIGNKRLYNSDQSSRNDDRNNQQHEFPASKKRRITNNNIIEDEYHEYENSFHFIFLIYYLFLVQVLMKK